MSKIAIITSDNRDLKFDNKKNTYVELCALINLNYAIKITYNLQQFITEI